LDQNLSELFRQSRAEAPHRPTPVFHLSAAGIADEDFGRSK